MYRKTLLFATAAMLLAACSKNTDFSSAPQPEAPKVNPQSNENSLGLAIDPAQKWTMTTQGSVKVKALPTGFSTKSIMILDANPFATEDVTILAVADAATTGSIAYELPSYLANGKLYIACYDGQGDLRVRSFDAKGGEVDFTEDLLKFTTGNAEAPSFHRAPAEPQKTLNATLFAEEGWNDEYVMLDGGNDAVEFTNFSEYDDNFKAFLPENQRNNRKLAKYDEILSCYTTTITEENGEVTIIPIHKESVNSQCIGYYYFLPGQEHNLKTVRKYIFPSISKIDDEVDVCTRKAFRLQYFDENGNASYQFPKGTEIGFFLHVDQTVYNGKLKDLIGQGTHLDWYVEGAVNISASKMLKELGYGTSNAEDGWEEFNHVVMIERNNELYVGMEDWVMDFDYNDIIFIVRGDVTGGGASDVTVPEHTHIYSYAFEDTFNGDYDLNDAVLQVKRIYGGPNLEVKLVAVGAKDQLYAYYKNEDGQVISLFNGKELHEACGVSQDTFVNTETLNVEDKQLPRQTVKFDYARFLYNKADFYIVNKTKNYEIHIPAAIGATGTNPYGVCVPFAWKWPKEKIAVTAAYPLFKGFAENMQVNTDWYTHEVEDKVFTKD